MNRLINKSGLIFFIFEQQALFKMSMMLCLFLSSFNSTYSQSISNTNTLHHYDRNPLVLATSADGKVFDKQYIIANSIYQLKKEGLWKGGQYGYPYTFIKDGMMYVIVSRQKEAIEAIRFKLNQL